LEKISKLRLIGSLDLKTIYITILYIFLFFVTSISKSIASNKIEGKGLICDVAFRNSIGYFFKKNFYETYQMEKLLYSDNDDFKFSKTISSSRTEYIYEYDEKKIKLITKFLFDVPFKQSYSIIDRFTLKLKIGIYSDNEYSPEWQCKPFENKDLFNKQLKKITNKHLQDYLKRNKDRKF